MKNINFKTLIGLLILFSLTACIQKKEDKPSTEMSNNTSPIKKISTKKNITNDIVSRKKNLSNASNYWTGLKAELQLSNSQINTLKKTSAKFEQEITSLRKDGKWKNVNIRKDVFARRNKSYEKLLGEALYNKKKFFDTQRSIQYLNKLGKK